MDGWKTFSFPFGARPILRCKLAVSFREGTFSSHLNKSESCKTQIHFQQDFREEVPTVSTSWLSGEIGHAGRSLGHRTVVGTKIPNCHRPEKNPVPKAAVTAT